MYQSELRTHIKRLLCTNQSSELLPCLHWLHGHSRKSCLATPGLASTTVSGAWTPQSHLRQGWACSLWWHHLCSGASWWTPGCRDASCGYQCTGQGHYHHHRPPSWISWGLCSWKTCPHAPEPHCLWSKHPPEESGTCQRHRSHSLQFKVINSRLSLIVQILNIVLVFTKINSRIQIEVMQTHIKVAFVLSCPWNMSLKISTNQKIVFDQLTNQKRGIQSYWPIRKKL